MIQISFYYPNSDGCGSWSFSLLPCIEAHYDGEQRARCVQFGWLFFGLNITRFL